MAASQAQATAGVAALAAAPSIVFNATCATLQANVSLVAPPATQLLAPPDAPSPSSAWCVALCWCVIVGHALTNTPPATALWQAAAGADTCSAAGRDSRCRGGRGAARLRGGAWAARSPALALHARCIRGAAARHRRARGDGKRAQSRGVGGAEPGRCLLAAFMLAWPGERSSAGAASARARRQRGNGSRGCDDAPGGAAAHVRDGCTVVVMVVGSALADHRAINGSLSACGSACIRRRGSLVRGSVETDLERGSSTRLVTVRAAPKRCDASFRRRPQHFKCFRAAQAAAAGCPATRSGGPATP
jgi:hypothetical protein